MIEQDFHNKKWGAEDLERYHSGKMPDREMHALERAALDDPFLEDALEGYAYTKTAVNDIEELRNKLAPKKQETKLVWYKEKGTSQFLKIAAILVLVFGFVWLLNINREEKKVEIASVPKIPAAINKTNTDSTATVSTEFKAVPEVETRSENKKENKEPVISLRKQKPEESKMDDILALAPAKTESDSESERDIAPIENNALLSKEKNAAAPAAVSQSLEGNVKGLVISNQNIIKGRVVDNEGNPVAFANINDRQNNRVLAADKEGYFSLSNRQNASNIKVDVNAIGFETNNVALSANTTVNEIVLKESKQALNEVVVTGYGARKKSTAGNPYQKKSGNDYSGNLNNTITLINALPADGWESFNRFINDSLYNKKLPASGYREVILQFDIDGLGKAQNIAIKKSASDSLDATARQMLQAIPALKKIKKGKNAEAVIRL